MGRGKMNGVFKSLSGARGTSVVAGETACICGQAASLKIDGHGNLFSFCDKTAKACRTKISTTTVEGNLALIGNKGTRVTSSFNDVYRELIDKHTDNEPPKPEKKETSELVDPAAKPEKKPNKAEISPEPEPADDELAADELDDDFTE